ncbi:MAG: helix-turn-helix domain-containing protein [Paracoccaceae bacterium]
MGKSNKRKGDGQYAPLTYAMLKSDAWRELSGAAVRVFLELHCRFNGSNNGLLTLSYAEAAEVLGMGKATVQRAFADLVAKGFVVLEKEGNWYHRQAHEWRLTIKPVQRAKGKESPTHDWIKYGLQNSERGSDVKQRGAGVVPFENRRAGGGSISVPVRRKRSSG